MNIGATNNYNLVFNLSKGEYFKWAAYDDVLLPDFISRCMELLKADESIILGHSKTTKIDEQGQCIGTYDFSNKITSHKTHIRFGYLINERHNSWVNIFGIIRKNVLKKTSLFKQCIGADRILLAELSLYGKFKEVPDYLFSRRSHGEAYTEKMNQLKVDNNQAKLGWWSKKGIKNFPTVKMFIEYIRSVNKSKLKRTEMLLCHFEIIKWFLKEGWLLTLYDTLTNIFGGSRVRYILSTQIDQIHNITRYRLGFGGG
jgi:hypothetical protein